MASSLKNPFALLDAVGGDDDSELILPAAVSSPSQGTPPPPQTQSGRQRGRRISAGQQNSLLKNKEGGNSQDERNGYRPNDKEGYQLRGTSNGYGRSNGRSEGYNHRRGNGNGYQQQNFDSPVNEKNRIHEQNGSDSLKPSMGDSSDSLQGESDQGEWHTVRARRKIIFTEDYQHIRNYSGERGSSSSQEKFTGKEFYGRDDNKTGNQRFSSSRQSNNRGGNSGNQIDEGRTFVSRGNGEVNTPKGKETPGQKFHGGDDDKTGNQRFNSSRQNSIRGQNSGNQIYEGRSFDRRASGEMNTPSKETPSGIEVPVINNGESANVERKEKEVVVDMKEAEQNGSKEKSPALSREAKDQRKEWKHYMTLREYEKQLLVKKKALESSKAEERKVALDKEFESMQLVGRKKEDLENTNSEKPKLKKEDSLDKDEKLKKVSMSIEEFQRKYRTRHYDRYRGPGRRGVPAEHEREGNPVPETTEVKAPDVMDSSQFPGLKSSA